MSQLPTTPDFVILTILDEELDAVKNAFVLQCPIEQKNRPCPARFELMGKWK